MRVILIPGWNEGADGMHVFVTGRHGQTGLASFGFDCTVFDGGRESMRDRIDQLAQYVAGLSAADPNPAPLALFGYSAGGLIARGLLRAYPDLPVAAVFQLAAPNAGIVTDNLAGLLHRIHFERSVIEDLDFESSFMSWLNQSTGRWTADPTTGQPRWTFDKKPWLAPANMPILNVVGRVPRYKQQSDGVVLVHSALLDGLVPYEFADGGDANHLNLGGTWNPVTLLTRGWGRNDRLWPLATAAAARLFAGAMSGV